nr:5793_t:CDS:2 [Entrophospora candida]
MLQTKWQGMGEELYPKDIENRASELVEEMRNDLLKFKGILKNNISIRTSNKKDFDSSIKLKIKKLVKNQEVIVQGSFEKKKFFKVAQFSSLIKEVEHTFSKEKELVYAIIDLETTGFSNEDEIIEIAYINQFKRLFPEHKCYENDQKYINKNRDHKGCFSLENIMRQITKNSLYQEEHRALPDALDNLKIFEKIMKEISKKPGEMERVYKKMEKSRKKRMNKVIKSNSNYLEKSTKQTSY